MAEYDRGIHIIGGIKMKQKIDVMEYAGKILKETGKGVLLTTKADGKVNTMTIGWGTLGLEWGKPIFTAFVRKSRYSWELLQKNPEFTVNIPYGDYDKTILGLCGTRSGRDVDKLGQLGLTEVASETVAVPGIKELPLTLECKVIYQQDQDPAAVSQEDTAKFYPKNEIFPEGDYHTAFYGQITAAYIIK